MDMGLSPHLRDAISNCLKDWKNDSIVIVCKLEDELVKIGEGIVFKIDEDFVKVFVDKLEDGFESFQLPWEDEPLSLEQAVYCKYWMCIRRDEFERALSQPDEYQDANEFLEDSRPTPKKLKHTNVHPIDTQDISPEKTPTSGDDQHESVKIIADLRSQVSSLQQQVKDLTEENKSIITSLNSIYNPLTVIAKSVGSIIIKRGTSTVPNMENLLYYEGVGYLVTDKEPAKIDSEQHVIAMEAILRIFQKGLDLDFSANHYCMPKGPCIDCIRISEETFDRICALAEKYGRRFAHPLKPNANDPPDTLALYNKRLTTHKQKMREVVAKCLKRFREIRSGEIETRKEKKRESERVRREELKKSNTGTSK